MTDPDPLAVKPVGMASVAVVTDAVTLVVLVKSPHAAGIAAPEAKPTISASA
jgi:hypothetical protein